MEEGYVEDDRFPDAVADDVDGLLWLGYLEDSFDYCGHDFVIRTLKMEDQLLCSLVTKEYAATIGEGKSWISAQVAMALVSVDGDENFCPPASHDKRDYARARFNYVISKWYEPTIIRIYESYVDLLTRQANALEAMENLSQKSLTTFMASPDSSKQKADSQVAQEIMEMIEEEEGDLTPFNESS